MHSNLEGNIRVGNTSGFGLYLDDTRFLSVFELKVNGRPPLLLSSVADRDYMAHIELTNVDVWEGDTLAIPQETLSIRRVRSIKNALYERIRVKNYNGFETSVELELIVAADFLHMFEVRGHRPARKGKHLMPKTTDSGVKLAYLGGDNVFRVSTVEFSIPPDEIIVGLDKTTAKLSAVVPPGGEFEIDLKVIPSGPTETDGATFTLDQVKEELSASYSEWETQSARVTTDNELFNKVLERGMKDLRALSRPHGDGVFFDAGIPWYVSLFGRDSLISAGQYQLLSGAPMRGTLEALAAKQGAESDEWKDEEPGKILHELRGGELANIGEIPHTPYYGSIDSTLLFLIYMEEHYLWTGDIEFVQKMRPSIESAIAWMDKYGDVDGDGFIEYQRKSAKGLMNQGWKDSFNAIVHKDGTMADGPIALVEVQGYAYRAKLAGARLLGATGDEAVAAALTQSAEALKKAFNEKFWTDEGYLGLALDGKKKLVETVTSNPGHCLWSGILDQDQAARVADELVSDKLFSGWGIRTMSDAETSYNPMSYHNGSVWPHDNALIAAGFSRYRCRKPLEKVVTGLFEAAVHHTYYRLPELFCGFDRMGDTRPVSYPVACNPQAWAAGAFFMLVQAQLGLHPDAPAGVLRVLGPTLPDWLGSVTIEGLKVGAAELDLNFTNENGAIGFTVLRKVGELDIILEG